MMKKIEHSIDIREMCSLPFAFSSNRVWRVYQGGKMIDALQHKPHPADSNFPEEWIASSVKACNPQRGNMTEGISNAILDGNLVSFQDLINLCPEELLGRNHISKFGKNTAFLTKLLDSSTRLPIQAHPDNLSAMQFYNSTFGKTEAWIILDTRVIAQEKPYLMLGFNESLDKNIFKQEAVSGNMPQSLQMLHKHPVASGDVLLISGGAAHAIGPGVFLLEIMEPTDLVVQPENYCGSQKLTINDRFGTLSAGDALKIFHYNSSSREEAWNKAVVKPEIIENSKYTKVISLLDRRQVKFFGATRINIFKEWIYDNSEGSCAAGVLLAGSCTFSVKNYQIHLQQGDCFFIPACCNSTKISGRCSFILTHPPVG
ncbi:MAG: class I mannose-6-phosphate isomerase [Victivallaceae bacterium]